MNRVFACFVCLGLAFPSMFYHFSDLCPCCVSHILVLSALEEILPADVWLFMTVIHCLHYT